MSHETLMMSSHDVSVTSQALQWHHRFPYKRHHAWPFRDLTWPGTWVHFGSEFDSILRVLMHARIDVLMHPRFWSLLPSSVLDWVVIIVSVHNASMPLNTLLHPVRVTSITLCTIFTGLSSFRLVLVSTVPSVKGLNLWTPGWHIILPCGTHHI